MKHLLLIAGLLVVVPPLYATWDPSVLGVPWANDFNTIAAHEINIKSPPYNAAGDGITDDAAALRAAIHKAWSDGGGTVYLPAGDYKIVTPSGAPIELFPRVLLRGDSAQTSRVRFYNPTPLQEDNNSMHWSGLSLRDSSVIGLTDLGLFSMTNSTQPVATLWSWGSNPHSKIFLNNLDIHLSNGRSVWIGNADLLLVQNSTMDSTSTVFGPIYIIDNTNVSFLNNTVTYNFGRVQMQLNQNALIQGNTFTRDSLGKYAGSTADGHPELEAIESGGIELSFGSQIQLLDNTFRSIHTPKEQGGDGEAIMTQHSNIQDFTDQGTISAVTATSLSDSSALWGPDTSTRLAAYTGHVVIITSGRAMGSWRYISNLNTSNKTITVDRPWDSIPEVGSLFVIRRWDAKDITLRGNTLIDNPIGITIYSGGVNCTIDRNTLYDSRSIQVRVGDNVRDGLSTWISPESRRAHDVALQIRVTNNTLWNTQGIRLTSVQNDVEAFAPNDYRGMGIYDMHVASNTLHLFPTEPDRKYIGYPHFNDQDAFYPCYQFGPALNQDPVTTTIQKLYFWNNTQDVSIPYDAHSQRDSTRVCITATAPPSESSAQLASTPNPRIYPNPWRSDRHAGLPLTIDQITAGCTLKIFTVSGHHVRTLTTSNTSAQWDMTNEKGDKVASGLYLYVVTDPSGHQNRGKFVIIK